ncbi:MAG TPA: imidazolonepropionase [Candidatus Polarisedimenticolaceae bacterium]|nr:imidazolonepropionase [Candidatus Polarisedimenticolaceae bacterium]
MIDADLVVAGIGELATPEGRTPRLGKDLDRLRIVHDAAVACRDGTVVFVGTGEELRARVRPLPEAGIVEAEGGTVLPGFVDAHTHLPFAGWREREFDQRLRGDTYQAIAARGGGILSTVGATRGADENLLTTLVRGRLDAMLARGTTTVEAKSGYGLTLEAELRQLRALRRGAAGHPVEVVPTFLGAHAVPPEHLEDRDAWVKLLVEQAIPAVAAEGLAEYADAFVDAHAFRPEEARTVLEAARRAGLGIRLHADQLADDGGAALAASLQAASADHLEHVSGPGIEALARAGTTAVLLPAAGFFLRSLQRPPARRLIEAGVPVAVATDFNPGTCPTDSMPLTLVFACLWAGLTVDEAITASTLNAAHALGRAERTGSLEVGKRADLVVHAVPNRHHLVYRFGDSRVRTVIAGGRVVYQAPRKEAPAC